MSRQGGIFATLLVIVSMVLVLLAGPPPACGGPCASRTVSEDLASRRSRILERLSNDDVQREFLRLGVDPGEAARVVERLDGPRLDVLALRLEQAEAGGMSQAWAVVIALGILTSLFLAIVHLGASLPGPEYSP